MKKLVSIFVFTIGSLLAQNVKAQAISLGNVIEVQTDGGFYKQLPVNCGLRTARRYLRQDSESNLWCDSIVGGFCADRPVMAAEIVCSRRYYAALQKHKRQTENDVQKPEILLEQTTESVTETTSDSSTNSTDIQAAAKFVPPTAPNASQATSLVSRPTVSTSDGESDSPTALFKQKSKLELLQELRSVEQELLDIQSARLSLRERDLELMRQQLREK